jgi:hypothetical protein
MIQLSYGMGVKSAPAILLVEQIVEVSCALIFEPILFILPPLTPFL